MDNVTREQTFSYTIAYENPSGFSLTGASLVDILPDGLEFVSASDPYTFDGTAVIWNLGTIGPYEEGNVTLTVETEEDAEGTITNCATLYTDLSYPITNCTDVHVIQVVPMVDKTASVDNVTREQTFSYTIAYENPSGFSLTGATLVDLLPAGLEFVSASDPYTFNGTAVTWDLGTIGPYGEGNVTLTVETEEDAEGTITNCATLYTDFTEPVESCTDVHVIQVVPMVEKTASVDNVTREQTFSYTIAYENPSGFSLTGATLVDLLPAGVEFVSATAPYTLNGTAVTWDLGTIGPYEEGNVTLTVETEEDAEGTITNCATLYTDFTEPVESCTDVHVMEVVPMVEKTASVDNVTREQTFSYTIAYENPSGFSLTGASLIDILPDGLEFVSASDPYTFNGTAVIWNLGTLAPYEEGNVTLTVETEQDAEGTITNCATLYTDFTEPVESCTDVHVMEVVPMVEKTASVDNVTREQTFSYTIAYENPSGFSLTGASLIDILPEGLEFVSASDPYTFNGTAVIWNLGTLAPYEEGNVTLTVETEQDVEGTITNCATLYTDFTEPVESCTDVHVMEVVPMVEKTASVDNVTREQTFSYTIAYENPSGFSLTGATLVDLLPAGVEFVSATDPYTFNGTAITWDLGTIGPYGEGNVTLTVETEEDAEGTITNCATLYTDFTEPVESCTDVHVMEVVPIVEKTASVDNVTREQTFSYTIAYENPSGFSLTGASLVDILPDGLEFVSATNPYTFNGTAVIWNLGTIGPYGEGNVTLTVETEEDAEGTITNCATLYTDFTEPVESCTDVHVMEVVPIVEKTASVDNVTREQTFSYTIAYENPSGFSLTGATLVDLLPAGVEFVSATDPYTFNGTAVTWDLGTIGPYEEGNVTLTVETEEDAEGTITNCATLYTDLTKPVESCTDVHVNKVVPMVEKTASMDNVTREQTFFYTLDWVNPSGFSLTGVSLVDILPAGLEFVSASDNGTFNGTAVTWDLGTIAPYGEGNVTLTVEVEQDAEGTITNCATFFTNQSSPVTNCTDVHVNEVVPMVEKTASMDNVTRQQNFFYTIYWENPSGFSLTGASLVDILPDGLEFVSASDNGTFNGTAVIWDLGTLAPYDAGNVTLTVEVEQDAEGTITNCANFFTNQSSLVTNCTDVTVVECIPEVNLTKTSSRPEVAPGESFVYTINYENSCCANLTDVVVSDHLPAEVVFVSATHGGVYDGNNVTWSIGNVPTCAEGELEIIVQVPLIINDPAVDNVVTFFSDQTTVSAVNTTVINPARIPDPHRVLVYPPTARFVALPSSGSSPLSVKFMDFSTGSPTAWLWDFGDNTTSHQRSPTHIYTSAGTYTVTLTAMNDWGANTVIKQNLIKVITPQSSSGTGSGGSILDRIRPSWYHG